LTDNATIIILPLGRREGQGIWDERGSNELFA
jgi:hypothetical protein